MSKVNNNYVLIIGAGHNGLVAATYLARAGFKVHMLERRSFIGGAAITQELWPGHNFSTCAHLMHGVHPKIFSDFHLKEEGLGWAEVAPTLYPQNDNSYFGLNNLDTPNNRLSAKRLTIDERKGAKSYEMFKTKLRQLFSPYRLHPPPTLEEFKLNLNGSEEEAILKRAMTSRIWDLQNEFLPSQYQQDAYASEGADVSRNPLALHIAYNSIDDPDKESGDSPPQGFVRGGMGALSHILANQAKEAGVEIQEDTEVDEILINKQEVVGVKLTDGTEIESAIVISNLDPKRTFLRLISPENLDQNLGDRINKLMTHVSCMKLLAVIDELPQWKCWDGEEERPHQGAVRLNVSRAHVNAAYDDLETGLPPRSPVISVNLPSFNDPSLTQPGYQTASIWIFPAPAKLKDKSWDEVREDVAENIINQITEHAPNFRRSIQNYILRTPLDLERENNLTDGCIWHIQHNGEQLFWNRPLPELSRYRSPIRGLYLCGAGQHPGGEVSGIPGHNAAHEIIKDLC